MSDTETLGARLARAIAAKDEPALRALLADDVDFRGLTPGRTWEASSPDEVVDIAFGHWFEDSDHVVADSVSEGDEVCGFRVFHMPGHAPGQIALFREADRVVLSTDVVYFGDSETFKDLDHPEVPHRAWNWDHRKAIESARKLASLDPAVVLAGHTEPQRRPDLAAALERAADEEERAERERRGA